VEKILRRKRVGRDSGKIRIRTLRKGFKGDLRKDKETLLISVDCNIFGYKVELGFG